MYTDTHSQLGMSLPGGVLWISSDRDDQRMFLGLNFSILGVLGVGKFCKNFFLCLFFVVIQNNLKFLVVPM